MLTFSSSSKRASNRGKSSLFKAESIRSYSGSAEKAHVHFNGLDLELFLESAHGIDDAFGQASKALILRVDAVLQPLAHLLLAVVAGFHQIVW